MSDFTEAPMLFQSIENDMSYLQQCLEYPDTEGGAVWKEGAQAYNLIAQAKLLLKQAEEILGPALAAIDRLPDYGD